MKNKTKKIVLYIATLSMILTTLLCNAQIPIHAANDKPMFEVNKADEVINEAKKHMGKPYVWGASGPNSFDCSGFVSYVLKQTGLSLGADRITTSSAINFLNGQGVTSYQYSTNESNPKNAKKGDLVFYYDTTGNPLHMGFYMGNGQIIHCAESMPSGPQSQVMISGVDDLGTKHGTTVISYRVFRVFPESGGMRLMKINEQGQPLAGVVFEITLPDGSKRNVTTNENGVWDSEVAKVDLEAVTYKVKEVSTIQGYLLDSTVRTITVKAGQKASENVTVITNKEPLGEITLTKYNDDKSATISGTTYQVTSNTGYNNRVTTNVNGQIHLSGLKLGTYTFTEIQASEGYLLNGNPITVTLTYKDQYTSIITASTEQSNDEPTASIHLTKEDKETGANNQGDASLQGAVYELIAGEDIYNKAKTKKFYSKGDVVATRITNVNGNMSDITNLPLGFYQLREKTASQGYLLDTTIYDVRCNYEGQDVNVIIRSALSKEQVMKQAFEIIKVSTDESEEATTLANAEFTVKLTSEINKVGWDKARTYNVLTTDKKGYAKSIELPFGTYTVRETKVPDNVMPIDDFTVIIDSDSRTPQTWRIFNDKPFKALIKAVKVDSETGKTVLLPDTTFKIKNLKTNEYVGQWVWFPIPHYIDIFKTDETGTVTTPSTLEIGDYQLEEIHAPNNYTVDTNPIKFTVSTNNAYQLAEDGKTPIITVTKKNESVKGIISVTKIGEQLTETKTDKDGNIQFIYDKLPVDGAEFVVEANETIYSADNQKDIIYKKGEVVSELTTVEGYASTKALPLGKYKVYEKVAGDTFVLNKDVKYIELTYEDENTPLVFEDTKYENTRQKVDLTIIKKDKDSDIALKGAVFGLYANEDIYSVQHGKTIEKQLLIKADTLIETALSDENGKAHFKADLPINAKFKVVELKAPIGYSSSNYCYQFDTRYYDQDIETIQFGTVFKNEITKTEISKQDITNCEEIAGASLIIYAKENPSEVFDSWISGQDGKNNDGTIKTHIIKGLEVGKTYVLKEISSPHGFAVADEIEFTVKDTGKIQSITMSDEIVFGQLKWNKTGEIFNQTVTGQTEFGKKESPVWNESNLLGTEITIYAAEDIVIGNNTYYKADDIVDVLESYLDAVYSKKLPVGRYYYAETKTPHGYITNTNKHYFEVQDNQINELQTITSTLKNVRPSFDIDLAKVLEKQEIFKNENAYKEIVFGIFAREDIYDYQGNVAIENGIMISTTGIDKDGHLIDVPDLPNGVYFIKELATNSQYILNDSEYDFEVAYHGADVSHYTIAINNGAIINELARGNILVKKVDVDNLEKVLSNIPFHISTQSDMSNILATVETNDKGIASFNDLELGTYFILEANQVNGYTLNSHIYKVEVTKNSDQLEIICENKPTEMEFSKQDFTTNKELAGAHITITDKETDKIIDEWTSTDTPHKIKYLIEDKEYIMTEISAPKGYEVAESITFTAKDGIKIIMKDKVKETVETGDTTHASTWLGLTFMSIGCLSAYVLHNKRKKRNDDK